ncbi:MAG: hypothetical protein AB8G22_27115 [Saprospiraceae bacterium]
MLLLILILLHLNPSPQQSEKEIKIRAFDIFTNEPFLDSLYFQYGTTLSPCKNKKKGVWLTPDELGFYNVKTSCKGFYIRTAKSNYSEVEYLGLSNFQEQQITIDSLPLFPFYGKDTTVTVVQRRNKSLFKRNKVEQRLEVSNFGTTGFYEEEIPREIEFHINNKKQKLSIIEFSHEELSGQSEDIYVSKYVYRLNVLYSNELN